MDLALVQNHDETVDWAQTEEIRTILLKVSRAVHKYALPVLTGSVSDCQTEKTSCDCSAEQMLCHLRTEFRRHQDAQKD